MDQVELNIQKNQKMQQFKEEELQNYNQATTDYAKQLNKEQEAFNKSKLEQPKAVLPQFSDQFWAACESLIQDQKEDGTSNSAQMQAIHLAIYDLKTADAQVSSLKSALKDLEVSEAKQNIANEAKKTMSESDVKQAPHSLITRELLENEIKLAEQKLRVQKNTLTTLTQKYQNRYSIFRSNAGKRRIAKVRGIYEYLKSEGKESSSLMLEFRQTVNKYHASHVRSNMKPTSIEDVNPDNAEYKAKIAEKERIRAKEKEFGLHEVEEISQVDMQLTDDEMNAGDLEKGTILDKSNEKLFSKKIDTFDIEQGALGDCYLVAAINSLATQHPQMIKDMIWETKVGDKTLATVRLFHKKNFGARMLKHDYEKTLTIRKNSEISENDLLGMAAARMEKNLIEDTRKNLFKIVKERTFKNKPIKFGKHDNLHTDFYTSYKKTAVERNNGKILNTDDIDFDTVSKLYYLLTSITDENGNFSEEKFENGNLSKEEKDFLMKDQSFLMREVYKKLEGGGTRASEWLRWAEKRLSWYHTPVLINNAKILSNLKEYMSGNKNLQERLLARLKDIPELPDANQNPQEFETAQARRQAFIDELANDEEFKNFLAQNNEELTKYSSVKRTTKMYITMEKHVSVYKFKDENNQDKTMPRFINGDLWAQMIEKAYVLSGMKAEQAGIIEPNFENVNAPLKATLDPTYEKTHSPEEIEHMENRVKGLNLIMDENFKTAYSQLKIEKETAYYESIKGKKLTMAEKEAGLKKATKVSNEEIIRLRKFVWGRNTKTYDDIVGGSPAQALSMLTGEDYEENLLKGTYDLARESKQPQEEKTSAEKLINGVFSNKNQVFKGQISANEKAIAAELQKQIRAKLEDTFLEKFHNLRFVHKALTIEDIQGVVESFASWGSTGALLKKIKFSKAQLNDALKEMSKKFAETLDQTDMKKLVGDECMVPEHQGLSSGKMPIGKNARPAYSKNANDLYTKIRAQLDAKNTLCCGTHSFLPSKYLQEHGSSGENIVNGLAEGHAYTILDIYEDEATKAKFVTIRNPWNVKTRQYDLNIKYDLSMRGTVEKVNDLTDRSKETKGVFDIELNDFLQTMSLLSLKVG